MSLCLFQTTDYFSRALGFHNNEFRGYLFVLQDIYFSAEHSPRPGDDLTLLSNDIPLSSSPDNIMPGWEHDDTAVIGKVKTPHISVALLTWITGISPAI